MIKMKTDEEIYWIQRVKDQASKTASRTTVHGIPNIVENEYSVLRIIWIVCFLGSTGFCAFMIYGAISDYFEYQVVTVIKTLGENPAAFPTVTICNKNFVVNEKSARFVEHELSDPRTRNITGNIIDAYDYTRYYFTSALARSGISDKERQSYGSSLEEMVIKCRFNNVACNKTYWKWRYDSYYGNCFMFNWDKNSVLNSKLSQKANGLSVVLYLPFYDNFYAFNSDFGAFVSINHVSASQMSSLNTGYDISVNTATNIALDRVVTNMLPPPYFDCIESEDIASYGSAYSHLFTEYNLTYKQSECFIFCYQKKLLNECGCYDLSILQMKSNQSACVDSVEKYTCDNKLYTQFQSFVLTYCLKDCPQECSSLKYPATIYSTKFPKDSYYYHLLATNDYLARSLFNLSSSFFRSAILNNTWQVLPPLDLIVSKMNNKIMALNVFYNALEYTQIDASPKTTAVDLLANVGGTLGLFLGASFLSFIELVDLVLHIGITWLYGRRQGLKVDATTAARK